MSYSCLKPASMLKLMSIIYSFPRAQTASDFLYCVSCLTKFDSSQHFPIVFRSGISYCAKCVQQKIHIKYENILISSQEKTIKKNQGKKNYELVSCAENDLSEKIREIEKEAKEGEMREKKILNEQGSKIKEENMKVRKRAGKVVKRYKKELAEIKKQQNQKQFIEWVQNDRWRQSIIQQKQKGRKLDEQIKMLEIEVEREKRKAQSKQKGITKRKKGEKTELQKLYWESKRQGLEFNFRKVSEKVIFEHPEEVDEEEEIDMCPVWMTKYFK